MISFRIEGIPPSYNRSIQIIWGLKETHLSPEAHAYKNRIKMSMPPCEFFSDDLLSIEIDYIYNFYYKNGRLKKIDTANCDKLLLDAISERLGIDDSHFKTRKVTDFHNEKEEFTIVRIEKL